MKAFVAWIAIIASAACPMTALASPLPRYGAFIFSSLCLERESGDISGFRLVLDRKPSGDKLAFEYGNGPLESADIVKLQIDGDKLHAEASTVDGKLSLEATLSEHSAVVVPQFGYQEGLQIRPTYLERVRGISNRLPTCR